MKRRTALLLISLFLTLATAGLHSRPVDLSIPAGGHGPISSYGYVLHWIELTEVDFGKGLSLPMRLSMLTSRAGNDGFGKGLWSSPILESKILSHSAKEWQVILPCGKILSLLPDPAQKGQFATPDGEWVSRVKGPRSFVTREDGWYLEFDTQRGLLLHLHTDTGRDILWNRQPDGEVRSITEVSQGRILNVGLNLKWDEKAKRVITMEARTDTGSKSWAFRYETTGQRLAEVTFPDRTVEKMDYSVDAQGNPSVTMTSRSLLQTKYVWHKDQHTLLNDGLWNYSFRYTPGDVYPITTRIGPNGAQETYHDDLKNSRVVFTSVTGTRTIRQNVAEPGPARGKLQSVTRILNAVKVGSQPAKSESKGPKGQAQGEPVKPTEPESILLYRAEYDPTTGTMTAEWDALNRKTTHLYTLHRSTPHSGVKSHTKIDPLGFKTVTEYDLQSNLLSVTDALGHTVRHDYDAQNRRVKSTGPDGTVTELLTYASQGQIATRTDALGAVTRFEYDAQGNQIRVIDALGNVTQHKYDSQRNRIATTDALGHTTRYQFDAGGHLTATTLPEIAAGEASAPLSAGKDSKNPPQEPATTRYTYDSKGRRISTTAPDGTVTEATTYDAFDRVASTTNALGQVTKYSYNFKMGTIGCGACSAASAKPTRIVSPSGRITERTYDPDQNLLTETIAAGTPDAATVHYTYSLTGKLLSMTDPLGRKTQFEYDANDQRITTIYPDNTKTKCSYNALGQLATTTDELGHIIKQEYDAYGNVISITDPEGNSMRTLFSQNGTDLKAAGTKDSRVVGGSPYAALNRPTVTISPSGVRTQIEYDLLGRSLTTTRAFGTPEAATTKSAFDAVGNEIAVTSPTGQITLHRYDSRRRRISTTDALNRTVTYLYADDSNQTAACCGCSSPVSARATVIVYPDGTREEKFTNALGQVIETRDANVTTKAAKTQDLGRQNSDIHGVMFEYDEEGRITSLTDAKGSVTKWRYDTRGKLAAKTYPDNSTELYEHDAAGQLIHRIRPDGTTATHSYDLRSRLLSIVWSDGKTEPSTFAYDAASHMILAENKSATIKRSYTPSGRMAKETQSIRSPVAPQLDPILTAQVGYSYTPDGQLAELTYPDATKVSYHYNSRGELAKVSDSAGHQTYHYQRLTDGRISQLEFPNGTVTHKTYDAIGRLSEIKHLDPAQKTLFSETSRYDNRDRRTARLHEDGKTDLFAYDPAGQVTAAAYGAAKESGTGLQPVSNPTGAATNASPDSPTKNFTPSQTFAYDSAGNRIEVTDAGMTTKYQTNAANQYTAISESAKSAQSVDEPRYDKLGNLLQDTRNTYTWDADIHLLSVTTKSKDQPRTKNQEQRTDFKYDALHRRVARTESQTQTTTLFIHDRWNVISEHQSGTGLQPVNPLSGAAANTSPSPAIAKSPSARHTWGDDLSGTLQGAGGIGGLLASTHSSSSTKNDEQRTKNWMHYDSNGNVILLTNAGGKESARYEYDAFGKTILAQGSAANLNRYQFSTKPIEKASGLAFYGYRYYLPELGRWLSKDPIEEAGGFNFYRVVNNQMVNLNDILGLETYIKDLELQLSSGSQMVQSLIDSTQYMTVEIDFSCNESPKVGDKYEKTTSFTFGAGVFKPTFKVENARVTDSTIEKKRSLVHASPTYFIRYTGTIRGRLTWTIEGGVKLANLGYAISGNAIGESAFTTDWITCPEDACKR